MKYTSTIKKPFVFANVVIIGVLSFSSPASAGDRKINSGAVCQPRLASQVSDFTYYSTGITNNATASRSVVCPVVRDNTFNTNGVNFAGVYVQGAGTHSCYFDNVDNDGTLGRWVYGSRSGTGYFATNLKTSTSQTPYVFLCTIPTKGELVTIRVDEF